MSAQIPQAQPERPGPPPTGHRPEDTDVRGVMWFVLWLLVAAVVIHVVMALLLFWFRDQEREADVAPPPLAEQREPPPEPRLQVSPETDLRALREAETRLLESYGWVDREAGVVRMPIERAMELMAQGRTVPAEAPAEPHDHAAHGHGDPVREGGQGR